MLSEAEVMQILEVSQEVLHGLIAAGQIHAVPTANGALGICKNSFDLRQQDKFLTFVIVGSKLPASPRTSRSSKAPAPAR